MEFSNGNGNSAKGSRGFLLRWSADVEAESQIESNDPYIRDEDHLADWEVMERLAE
ncbi:MAG: hypothetical protein FWG26_08715 [Betaproteobacteria bacterium]|nr:hypothetical protein [Betaproteobacteria bacterium]